MSKPGIAIEPEHCGVCEGVRKLSSCAMCGARVCRFCEWEHVEGHDDGDLPTAAQIQNAISWGRDV